METGFGWIEAGGTRYSHNIVIHTDGKVSKRTKRISRPARDKYGHTPLTADELAFLEIDAPSLFT
jgi:hypothetical protein